MNELHKKMTVEDIRKIQWCSKVALYLQSLGWSFHEGYEVGECLHYDYVEIGDPDCDPIEAIQEDMTYWD